MAILAAVACLGAAPWGRADDDALVAAVDAIAADALQPNLAGMSVAVGRGSAVLMAKGYGFANVELEAPARADTVYHVDSITKFMTAAAILKLADEGRLNLEDDVGRWVPGLSTPARPIRIRHLLNHTSGLPSYTSLPGFAEKERLDLSHEEADTFDIVLAAPHSRLRKTEDQTTRMLRAMEAPKVRILAHPRGRISGSRAGVVADWDAVFASAAERSVAIEIDGDPARQDVDYTLAQRALKAGCLFALDSDAHTTGQLSYAETALAHARLAGIAPDRIVNCWDLDRLLEWVRRV